MGGGGKIPPHPGFRLTHPPPGYPAVKQQIDRPSDRGHAVCVILRGRLKRSARAVQLFGRLAVLETHTLRY